MKHLALARILDTYWTANLERRTLLLLSDTHGTLEPRIAARAARVDVVVHAGDIGSSSVLDTLELNCEQVIAIRGNNDVSAKWAVEERHRLEALPRETTLSLPGGLLVVVHGDQHGAGEARHRRLRRQFADARAVVFGHSHQRVLDRRQWPMLLNPGAAGAVRTYGGPSCMMLHATSDGRWSVRSRRYMNYTGERPSRLNR